MSVVYLVIGGKVKRRPLPWRRYRVEFYYREWCESSFSSFFLLLAKRKADWYAQGDISARVIDTWKEK